MLTANNWNVVQYAVLVHMFARASGLAPGQLVHVIADAHIYDRHVPLVEKLLEQTPAPAPRFTVDPADAPPLALLLVLVAIPGVIILGVLLALFQRIKEIQKGEEDDAKNY